MIQTDRWGLSAPSRSYVPLIFQTDKQTHKQTHNQADGDMGATGATLRQVQRRRQRQRQIRIQTQPLDATGRGAASQQKSQRTRCPSQFPHRFPATPLSQVSPACPQPRAPELGDTPGQFAQTFPALPSSFFVQITNRHPAAPH